MSWRGTKQRIDDYLYHYRFIRRVCFEESDADENATQHFCQVAKNKNE